MSLRTRLLAAIFAALLISFSVGAGLAIWQAARTVHDELATSLASARQGMLATLAAAPTQAELRQMVAAYDGNRHIGAALLDTGGHVRAKSVPAQGPPPPAWFLRLVSPAFEPVEARVAGVGALSLTANPASEVGERWGELNERVASFAVFFAAAALLCSITVGRSLRPLTALAQGFARVGRGELGPDLPAEGPPEIAALAAAFNRMAAALRAAEARNRQLSRQVMTIAEEERADIARDLHDDIGPLLFAITAFAAAAGRMVETGALAEMPPQLAAIQDATAQVQRGVRDMLGRLHGGAAAPADLAASLQELAAFWRSVRPETAFAAEGAIPETSDAIRECLFRAAQEGITNAMRHGQPRHVWVRAGARDGMARLAVQDDGCGGREGDGPRRGLGLGLAGMRARAACLGGQVEIVRGAGWTVTVSVPLEGAA